MRRNISAARLLDEDAAHGFGGGREEVAAAVPALGLLGVYQAQIGFMDQGGGLECLPRLFLSQLLGRQLPQLVINQRQQLLSGVRVALLDGTQDLRPVAHRDRYSGPAGSHFTSISGLTHGWLPIKIETAPAS